MKIALVGLSPLNTIGLSSLIAKRFPEMETCEVAMTDKSSVTSQVWQQSDCYIVSAAALAVFARFLMPKLDRILLLTTSVPEELQYGGRGIAMISPLATEKELIKSIETLIFISSKGGKQPSAAILTEREIEVLRQTALGLTAKEVAAKLCISVNTVLTHRKNLSAKLGLRSASALTHYAMIHGLMQ